MLGRANMAQGQVLRAIRAEAEAQVALLDYAAAMDRFKAAQGMVRDAPEAPVSTISRRRSSTPARARCSHCFGNRRSSADSISRPSTE